MVEHTIGNVAVCAINCDIIHISCAMFNADYFIDRVFLAEPLVTYQVLAQVFSFARKTKADFLRVNLC